MPAATIYRTSPVSLTRDVTDSALDHRFHEWGAPRYPGALATKAELCQHWRDMDSYHGTATDSPLHHDHRCELHNP